ncbi:MAG: HesA/MoeB/ThiF family protein, partial [Lentisphaerae bacterium]|nr:HesA/MoeB/ThiF family protein [Lentisphaerota bacterium]
MSTEHTTLTPEERAVYEWQLDVPGFGEGGQEHLKGATALVSRVGGLGSVVAYELAAAGIGRLVLAHAGDIKHSDLNRQLLMTQDALGTARVRSAEERLKQLNPRLVIEAVPENVCAANASRLVREADVIVDCAPLFEERFAMNREAVGQRKPLVECAMFELQAQITTVLPGRTPCLECLYPASPPAWQRR